MQAYQYKMLLQSLATTLADYRQDEILPITSDHIERWLRQFDKMDQFTILAEMDEIMKRFYISKMKIKEHLRIFIRLNVIEGRNPATVLPHIYFLNIQRAGNSQSTLLAIIDEVLREDYASCIDVCGVDNPDTYIYVDDAIYTGNRMRYDLTSGQDAVAWIPNTAKPGCTLIIYTIAVHLEGWSYVKKYIESEAIDKDLEYRNFYGLRIDNTRYQNSKAEFLWPGDVSYNDQVDNHILNLRTFRAQKNWRDDNLFRGNGLPAQERLFSSANTREIVEKAFLMKGVQIFNVSQNPAESMRPLGFAKLPTLGFGTFFVTYQNIANNCPLVLWWGDPTMPSTHPFSKWYPLFPRRTNVPFERPINGIIFNTNPF